MTYCWRKYILGGGGKIWFSYFCTCSPFFSLSFTFLFLSGEITKSELCPYIVLVQVAVFFDPEMLRVENLNYSSERTILFQRLSVILTDLVFAAGAFKTAKNLHHLKVGNSGLASKEVVVVLLLVCNGGLFLVDHIHFQYNGFLFGILLLSIGALMEGSFLTGKLFLV